MWVEKPDNGGRRDADRIAGNAGSGAGYQPASGMNRDAWKRYSAEGNGHHEVVEPGFKYNMTDIQAAIGLGTGQLLWTAGGYAEATARDRSAIQCSLQAD